MTSDVNVLWKDTAPTPRFQVTEPPTETVDLAVVGGGLAGMWTAHRFLEARPDASVVVIERDRVGSGASGRAGGYLNPRYGTTVHHILSHGKEEGRASYHVGESAITELERFVADRRIGCDFQRASHITFAMSGLQERRLRKDLDATREMGIDTMREITPAELDKQVRLPASYVAYGEQNCALVHPLKLLRGLTAHCVARGVGVVEECELLRVRHERTHVTAHTTRGDVKARAVVLATGTWAGEQRALKRQVVTAYTYAVATEPLPQDVLDHYWPGSAALMDRRFYLQWWRKTADNRIVIGGRDAPVSYGSRVRQSRYGNEPLFVLLRRSLRDLFPEMGTVEFTHGWGGPVDITPRFVPRIGTLPGGRVHYMHGFNGHGLTWTFYFGRALSALALGDPMPDPARTMIGPAQGRYPHEPLRSLGARIIRRQMLARDEAADRGVSVRSASDPLLMKFATSLAGRSS